MLRIHRTGLAALVLFAATAMAARGEPPPAPHEPPRAQRVLLVSIDGLRPDVLLRAKAPSIHSLMRRGSYSMWATTVAVAVTLPAHVSMLTGVTPAKHGIEWNRDLPLASRVYPSRPTLFEVARGAGYTTAMAAGKSKFSALAKPGTLDWAYVPQGTMPDSMVSDTVVRWIHAHRPQVLFVHLAGVDVAGHAKGWGSDAQLAAVTTADGCVGRMLGALRAGRMLDRTVVLVTSDHGGAGRTHAPDDPRSREIPWIIAGPGIRRGFDLTTDANVSVRTEDTFATLCWLLGVALPDSIDGRPVSQILVPD